MTRLQATVLLLCAAMPAAHAGQPLVTDDAAVVAPDTCQLEAWQESSHAGHQYGLTPTCNLLGDLELNAGAARTRGDGGERSSQSQIQAKSTIVSRDGGAWALGAEAGLQRDTSAPRGGSAFQTTYAKGLASLYPSDALQFDVNLGAANTYGSGTIVLAGADVQYSPLDRVQLLGEVFRDEPGRAKYQAGIRFAIIPDRFEAFVSYGSRFAGRADDWWAIAGIRLQSPPMR